MLPQCEFDKPLLACDCALVRGEDSTVRVQLAGTPLLWMLYPQTQDTHLVKLAAFTKLYTRSMAEDDARIWSVLEAGLNGRILTPAAWSAYRDRFPAMQKAAPGLAHVPFMPYHSARVYCTKGTETDKMLS